MKYEIVAHYAFYANTYNAPEDGPISDENGNPLIFSSEGEARAHLDDGDYWEQDTNHWRPCGRYDLDNGEYASPWFEIVEG